MSRLVLLLALCLSACATVATDIAKDNGIVMTPQEAAACKAQGCTVWTADELQELVNIFYMRGRANSGSKI
jgi:uncharacterized protein YceK